MCYIVTIALDYFPVKNSVFGTPSEIDGTHDE